MLTDQIIHEKENPQSCFNLYNYLDFRPRNIFKTKLMAHICCSSTVQQLIYKYLTFRPITTQKKANPWLCHENKSNFLFSCGCTTYGSSFFLLFLFTSNIFDEILLEKRRKMAKKATHHTHTVYIIKKTIFR